MLSEDLKNLNNQELAQELKNRKNRFTFMSVLIVGMIIIAIMDTVRDGVNYFTFFPLFFVPLALINYKKYKAVKTETASRNFK